MLDVTRLCPEDRKEFTSDLDEIAQEGARRMLAQALEAEVADYIARNQERGKNGLARVVRNGKARPRKVSHYIFIKVPPPPNSISSGWVPMASIFIVSPNPSYCYLYDFNKTYTTCFTFSTKKYIIFCIYSDPVTLRKLFSFFLRKYSQGCQSEILKLFYKRKGFLNYEA